MVDQYSGGLTKRYCKRNEWVFGNCKRNEWVFGNDDFQIHRILI
jgi:hypothetical protein